MRTQRVATNETCNQNCPFCNARRPAEDPAFVARSRVLERIAGAAGAEELVLTGGEPTLRRDLPALIAAARDAGAGSVVLETNATVVDAARARGLAEAGLTLARVHLPGWGDAYESVTRNPGSFAAALAGVRALAGAGVAVELAVPLVAGTLDAAPTIPAAVQEAGLPVRALVLGWPVEGPDPGALLAPGDAAAAVEAVEAEARRVDLPVRLADDAALPPCLFAHPARVAHLFSLTRGGSARPGLAHLPACDGCAVRDRCPGLAEATLARHPDLEVTPIVEDRLRRRLSTIADVGAQVDRELYQDDMYRRETGEAVPSRIVRVNFRCNQACTFCFVSTHLPAADDAAVEAAIVEMARQGGVVVLSGGEPTLNRRLLDYVRLARREGAPEVELQTNAINLGDRARVDALVEAGVTQTFISLHGPTAAISDTVTRAPGTFEKTVAGIDQVVAAGLTARLNFVFCQANLESFPDHVDLVARRWPGAELAVSFVAASTDVVPRSRELVPRYVEVLPALAEGMRRAEATGLRVLGFESMCGIPLCLVPRSLENYLDLATVPPGFDQGEFLHAEACEGCDLKGRCFGIRRGYAELYGTSEFQAVRLSDSAADGPGPGSPPPGG